jgi:hypothetical protein
MAMLSPLRFHYDDDRFQLPVRLGLLNSQGTQDLLVHILARSGRYELANYPNLTIPTNIELGEAALGSFGAFYVALFDKALEAKPGAAVTEYAWSAGSCDPCPGPTLADGDVKLLGGDVVPGGLRAAEATLTRLHLRYTKDSLGQDLVFRAAPPLMGGNGWTSGPDKHGAVVGRSGGPGGGQNMFQGRYIVRHPWKGDITCTDPEFGRWGDQPGGVSAARDLAFAPREGTVLASLVVENVPSLGLVGTAPKIDHVTRIPLTAYAREYLQRTAVAVALGLVAGAGLLLALVRRARRAA